MNAEMVKRAILEGILEDDDFDGFDFLSGDMPRGMRGSIPRGMPSDFGDLLNKLNLKVKTKEPEHISADASVVGEKAKGEAQFAHFSQAISALHSELEEKTKRLKDVEERSEERAKGDQERVNGLIRDLRDYEDTLGHLRHQIRRTDRVLEEKDRAIRAEKAMNEKALQSLKEVLLGSGKEVTKRLQPVLEALNGKNGVGATDGAHIEEE